MPSICWGRDVIIEMSKNEMGAWVYHDVEQAELVFIVLALTGWDVSGFDDWINTESHWEKHASLRDHLIALRHRLTQTYRTYFNDNYVIELEAERLLAEAHKAAGFVRGVVLEQKVKATSETQASRRKGKGKLSESDIRAIQREFKVALTPYGLKKALARKYNVSEDTIGRALTAPR